MTDDQWADCKKKADYMHTLAKEQRQEYIDSLPAEERKRFLYYLRLTVPPL